MSTGRSRIERPTSLEVVTTEQRANVSGWMVLLFGVVVTATGGIVLWALWDAPPESVDQRLLMMPFILGLPSLVFGLYSVIKKSPFEDDGSVRYPYPSRRTRALRTAVGDPGRSAAAGDVGTAILLWGSLLLVLGGIMFGVLAGR
jgi:hypothetical protein